jgi:FAD/FMN-containing dehydrogenase
MELMDKVIIKAVEEVFHLGLPLDADALLLIDVDGDAETVERQAPLVADFCKGHGVDFLFYFIDFANAKIGKGESAKEHALFEHPDVKGK